MRTTVRDGLEELLRRRRVEMLRTAVGHEGDLRALAAERESELEERAQDEQLDRVLARLDDRERREISAINAALDRIADGTYGRCLRCEAAIEIDRLAVLPETPHCVRCAAALERAHATATPAPRPSDGVPADLGLLTDAEKEALLCETIEADERIDHDELRISCRGGVVRLEGVLPSEAEHAILRQLVEDVVGFRDVVDRIRIDEAPWERADRAPAVRPRPSTVGPAGTDDAVESVDEGIAFEPSDRPLPEES